MFGDAIDYSQVRVVRAKWWPFQYRGIVMAPTGNIHFHPDDPRWSEDFSNAPLDLQGLFIHEMTHVWQTQLRGRFYLPLMRHPFCRYAYDLVPGRPFDRYGLSSRRKSSAMPSLRSAASGWPLCPTPRCFLSAEEQLSLKCNSPCTK